MEETGVKPVIGNLVYLQQFAYKSPAQSEDQEQLELFFNIKNAEDYGDIDLSATSHGASEIEEIAFINPKVKTIQPDFLSRVDLLKDIAANSPTKIFNYL